MNFSKGPVAPARSASASAVFWRYPARAAWLACALAGSLLQGAAAQVPNAASVAASASAASASATSVAQAHDGLALTPDERAWLAAHPVIRIGVDAGFAPYAFIDARGHPAGASAEITALVAQRLGVRFELVPQPGWPQILEAARQHDLDVITTATFRPERTEYLRFTRNYLGTPSVVMTRSETPRIRDLQELGGRRVALVKAYSSSKQFLARYPRIEPVYVDTPVQGLGAVASGSAEAYVGVLGINTYLAARHGISNLKVNTGFDMSNGQAYGVRKDWPELVPLLEKALDSIPDDQMQAILARWISVSVDSIGSSVSTLDKASRDMIAALPELRVGVLPMRDPFDFIGADGKHTGLAADVLALVRKRTGLRTRTVAMSSAQALRDGFVAGELDLLLAVNGGLAGVPAKTLTEPYFSSALGVFARRGEVFLGELRDLLDRQVAVDHDGISEDMLAQYPRIALQPHDSLVDAARALLSGKADYLVAESSSALRKLEAAGVSSLDYAGPLTAAPVTLRMAVSPQLDAIRPLINAAIESITPEEATAIRKRWLGTPIEAGLAWRPVLQWAVAALLLVMLGYAAFFAVNRRLRREVALRKQTEHGLMQANEARDRAEARHRESIGISLNLLMVLDSEVRIRQVSQPMARLVGYDRDELIGQPAAGLVPERLREAFSARMAAFFQTPVPTPSRPDRPSLMLCKDGSEHAVETTLTPITEDAAVFAIVTVIDVAPRLAAEALLRESEERLRDLFDSASDLIQVVDTAGRFQFVNRSWREALGYSDEEVKALSLDDVIHPDSLAHCRDLVERVTKGQPAGRFEAAFVTRQGQRIELEGHVSLRLQDGRPQALQAILRDVTERNRQTAELALAKQRAERADRAKSAFLATMSHELRTPLNSIIGFSGVLAQGLAGPINPEQSNQLRMVRTSAKHLLALINDVLDLSKIEAGELALRREAFELHASITKVVQIAAPLAQAKGLRLRADLPQADEPMVGDARRVEQVLLNLLANAIKFTPAGEVTLAVEAAGAMLRVSVSDTGPGIKAQDMGRLFQPFGQLDNGLDRHHDGTGLGLVISRHLARLMGGDVEAQSEWGKGSTFILSLARRGAGAGEV